MVGASAQIGQPSEGQLCLGFGLGQIRPSLGHHLGGALSAKLGLARRPAKLAGAAKAWGRRGSTIASDSGTSSTAGLTLRQITPKAKGAPEEQGRIQRLEP